MLLKVYSLFLPISFPAFIYSPPHLFICSFLLHLFYIHSKKSGIQSSCHHHPEIQFSLYLKERVGSVHHLLLPISWSLSHSTLRISTKHRLFQSLISLMCSQEKAEQKVERCPVQRIHSRHHYFPFYAIKLTSTNCLEKLTMKMRSISPPHLLPLL